MEIVHLVRAVTWGGGERYALDLCRASVEAGHDVTVVTKGSPLIDSRFAETGARIERLPLGGTLDLRSPRRLARLIRELPGEEVVIHVHTFKDAEIAARARFILARFPGEAPAARKRVRLICTRHLVKPGKRSPRWNFIYRHIDTLIFVSDLARRVFLEGRPSIPASRLAVVHNSILPPPVAEPLSVEAPPPVPLSVAGPPSVPRSAVGGSLLFTGRLSPEKGLEPLIQALPLLNDLPITLRIAGTGKPEYISSLKALAEKEGVAHRIEWLGFVPDIYAEIQRADICLAPSVWREPFGLTIIEFMSQARPVITTDNGAQPEIITDGHDGLLVPPSDSPALAAAIRRLLADPSERKKIGDNALRTFRARFAYPIFFSKIMDIYRQ